MSSEVPITSIFLGQKCDLIYISELRANWAFQALSSEIEIYRSSQPLKQTHQTFMLQKSWQSHLQKINQAITNIRQSGELKNIVDAQTQFNLIASK